MLGVINYSKIEVLLRTKIFWGEKDPRIDSTEKVEYENAKFEINGGYLIISKNETIDKAITTSSVVYPLEKVITFRTTL